MANPNPDTSGLRPIKPGEVRNPQGYSRGRRAVDDLLDLIAEKKADRAIALKWLERMLAGDFRYLQAYLDRRDGKVKEHIEVTERKLVVDRRDRKPKDKPADPTPESGTGEG